MPATSERPDRIQSPRHEQQEDHDPDDERERAAARDRQVDAQRRQRQRRRGERLADKVRAASATPSSSGTPIAANAASAFQ